MARDTITVRGACPHDCPDTCALQVTVEGGRAVRVAGNPDHPPTHGALCTKVARYPERSYHPQRVLQPLRRVGPKGAGQFEPVGWDEALGAIAARLRAIAARDPEAIVPYSYWTARSAPRLAAPRSRPPTAASSACTSSTLPRAG